jgi:Mn-dependent DtxR family transcriptional regulator
MLHQFLKRIQEGETSSLATIAQSLKITPAMAERMANDLAATLSNGPGF